MARNANHVTDHNELVALLDEQAARFGYTKVSGGPFSENDPAHIEQHNLMVTDLQGLAALAGQSFSTVLPPVANRGDAGHPKDHDAVRDALTEVAGWAAWNAASGGTVQTVENYNGTGQRWTVHTFTGNGTFTVTRNAQPFRVLVVGGGGGADWLQGSAGGYGGQVVAGNRSLPATANAVNVGAGGNGGQGNGEEGPGGSSVLGPLTAQGGAGKNSSGSKGGYTQQAQVTDNIDNTERKYSGRPTNGSWGSYRGAGGYNANGGTGPGGQSGVVIVAYRVS